MDNGREIGPYNMYQERTGESNKSEIARVKELLLQVPTLHKWDCSQALIRPDGSNDGNIVIGTNKSFEAELLGIGMMATAERFELEGRNLIKMRYPHIDDQRNVTGVDKLYFDKKGYDLLRAAIREELEKQGILESKTATPTYAYQRNEIPKPAEVLIEIKRITEETDLKTSAAEMEKDPIKAFQDLWKEILEISGVEEDSKLWKAFVTKTAMPAFMFHGSHSIESKLRLLYPEVALARELKNRPEMAEKFKVWLSSAYDKYGDNEMMFATSLTDEEVRRGGVRTEAPWCQYDTVKYNLPGGVSRTAECVIINPTTLPHKVAEEIGYDFKTANG